jgi:hypothetical protein
MGGAFSCPARTLPVPGMAPGFAMHHCLPTPRACSDDADRRLGEWPPLFPCGSRKPRRPAGSTQQGPVVMDGNEPTRRGCSDGAIRRPGRRSLPGWRAGVARAGGRSSWWTRCGCSDKHRLGTGRRAVKRLNGPMAMMPQASSAWAFAVGLSNLTLRLPVRRQQHSDGTPTSEAYNINNGPTPTRQLYNPTRAADFDGLALEDPRQS